MSTKNLLWAFILFLTPFCASAQFTAEFLRYPVGVPLKFTPQDLNYNCYEWTFIDDHGNVVGTSSEVVPKFAFPSAGWYDVQLKYGATTYSQTSYVEIVTATADGFSSNYQTVCPGQIFTLRANLQTGGDEQYQWIILDEDGCAIANSQTDHYALSLSEVGFYDVILMDPSGDFLIPDLIRVRRELYMYDDAMDQTMMYRNNRGISVPWDNNVTLIQGTSSTLGVTESASTICNKDGQVLFYNVEWNVFDRFGDNLTGGTPTAGISTSQSAIMPIPGTCNTRYFLFTVEAANPAPPFGSSQLLVSTIDMNGNEGLGTITALEISTPPGGSRLIQEKIAIAPHCNGTDYWVLAFEYTSNELLAFRVRPGGVDAPISTGYTAPNGNYAGDMKVSPDGTRIAFCSRGLPVPLYDQVNILTFDNESAAVTQVCAPVIPTSALPSTSWSCEFSPNSQFVYAGTRDDKIVQIDLQNNCTPTTVFTSTEEARGFELAANGVIYFTSDGTLSNFIGEIRNPNVGGPGCNVVPNANNTGAAVSTFSLANGGIAKYLIHQREELGIARVYTKCKDDPLEITCALSNSNLTYEWTYEDGTVIQSSGFNTVEVTELGDYMLQVIDGDDCVRTATFEVQGLDEYESLVDDQYDIPCGLSVDILAPAGLQWYQWSTGDHTHSTTISEAGTYYLRAKDNHGCIVLEEFIANSECCSTPNEHSPFEKGFYSSDYEFEPTAMVKTVHGEFIVAGISNANTTLGQLLTNRGITVIKTNSQGQLLDQNRIEIPGLEPRNHQATQYYDFRLTDMNYTEDASGNEEIVITAVGWIQDGLVFGQPFYKETQILMTINTDLEVQHTFTYKEDEHFVMNSVEKSYAANTTENGYFLTGSEDFQSIAYGIMDYSKSYSWVRNLELNHTSFAFGVESVDLNVAGLNQNLGYVIAGVSSQFIGGNHVDGIVLASVLPNGNMNTVRRLNVQFTRDASGILVGELVYSDLKLIRSQNSDGATADIILMYSVTEDVLNVVKLDIGLNVIWAQEFSTGSGELKYGYDIVQDDVSNQYHVFASNDDGHGLLFTINPDGSLESSNLSQTHLLAKAYQTNDQMHFAGFNDRLIMDNGDLVTIGAEDEKVNIFKFNQKATSCSNIACVTATDFAPSFTTLTSQDYTNGSLSPNRETITPTENIVSLKFLCCGGNTSEENSSETNLKTQSQEMFAEGVAQFSNQDLVIVGYTREDVVKNGQAVGTRGVSVVKMSPTGAKQGNRLLTFSDLFPSSYNNSPSNRLEEYPLKVQDVKVLNTQNGEKILLSIKAFYDDVNNPGNAIVQSLTVSLDEDLTIETITKHDLDHGELSLNSIDPSFDVAYNEDGSIATGGDKNDKLFFGRLDHSQSFNWSKTLEFTYGVTEFNYGTESIELVESGSTVGYLIAGIYSVDNGSGYDEGLVLIRTDLNGVPSSVNRLDLQLRGSNNVLNSPLMASDIKLIRTTSADGSLPRVLLMYSAQPGEINLVKLTHSLGVDWAFKYEADNQTSDFLYGYDVSENFALNRYQVAGANNNDELCLFEVDFDGTLVDNRVSLSSLVYSPHQHQSEYEIDGYSDRLIVNQYSSFTIGDNLDDISVLKVDDCLATKCSNPAELTQVSIAPTITEIHTMDYVVDDANVHQTNPEIFEQTLCLESNNCGVEVVEDDPGDPCNFIAYFELDNPCNSMSANILDYGIIGSGPGNPQYVWTLNGTVIATDESPNLENMAEGWTTLCLTVSFPDQTNPPCARQVCTTFHVGMEEIHTVLTTCTCIPFAPVQANDLDYYQLDEIGDVNNPEDGPDFLHYDSRLGTYISSAGHWFPPTGWITHCLEPGVYRLRSYTEDGCLKREEIIEVNPGQAETYQNVNINVCIPDDQNPCVTFTPTDLLGFCQPNNGLLTATYDIFQWTPSPTITICGTGPYTVSTTLLNGCPCTISGNLYCSPEGQSPNQGLSAGSENMELPYMELSPNPSEGIIKLRLFNLSHDDLAGQHGTLEVRDLTGKLVHTESMISKAELNIDLKNLAEGSYVLTYRVKDQLFVSKIALIK